jgi:hypothetical protein
MNYNIITNINFTNLTNEEELFIKIFYPLNNIANLNIYHFELLSLYFKNNITYLGLLNKPRKIKGALRKLINKYLILKLSYRDIWCITQYGYFVLSEYKKHLNNQLNNITY